MYKYIYIYIYGDYNEFKTALYVEMWRFEGVKDQKSINIKVSSILD